MKVSFKNHNILELKSQLLLNSFTPDAVTGSITSYKHLTQSSDKQAFDNDDNETEVVEAEIIAPETVSDVYGACIGKLPSCAGTGVSSSGSANTYVSYDDNLSRPPTIYYRESQVADYEDDIPDFVPVVDDTHLRSGGTYSDEAHSLESQSTDKGFCGESNTESTKELIMDIPNDESPIDINANAIDGHTDAVANLLPDNASQDPSSDGALADISDENETSGHQSSFSDEERESISETKNEIDAEFSEHRNEDLDKGDAGVTDQHKRENQARSSLDNEEDLSQNETDAAEMDNGMVQTICSNQLAPDRSPSDFFGQVLDIDHKDGVEAEILSAPFLEDKTPETNQLLDSHTDSFGDHESVLSETEDPLDGNRILDHEPNQEEAVFHRNDNEAREASEHSSESSRASCCSTEGIVDDTESQAAAYEIPQAADSLSDSSTIGTDVDSRHAMDLSDGIQDSAQQSLPVSTEDLDESCKGVNDSQLFDTTSGEAYPSEDISSHIEKIAKQLASDVVSQVTSQELPHSSEVPASWHNSKEISLQSTTDDHRSSNKISPIDIGSEPSSTTAADWSLPETLYLDRAEKQADSSSTGSGTSYDFGSSVDDPRESDDLGNANRLSDGVRCPEFSTSAFQDQDETSQEPDVQQRPYALDVPESEKMFDSLGSNNRSRPSFGGLSAISSEGQRRLSFSDVDSDSEDITSPHPESSSEACAEPGESCASSTVLSSTDMSFVGGSYIVETGQVTDIIADPQQHSDKNDALTISTSISDDVFVDSCHESNTSSCQSVDAVSVPSQVDPLSSIIDFGKGEKAQCEQPTSLESDSKHENSCCVEIVIADSSKQESASETDMGDEMDIFAQDTENVDLSATQTEVSFQNDEDLQKSPSFEMSTSFASKSEDEQHTTSESLAAEIVAQAIADSVRFYQQERSPPADESRSGSNNSIYDNLMLDDPFEPVGAISESEEYNLYQSGQLSAVEELSENEGSIGSAHEEQEESEQHTVPDETTLASVSTDLPPVEPATATSNITETMESYNDDDVDISSVDSYNTVILPDDEDRLAEIASMTSSFRSDIISGSDIAVMPMTSVDTVSEPSTPKALTSANSCAVPLLETVVIQRYPRGQDTDTVSVSSSLAEFEHLENQVGFNRDSPRSSFYAKRPMEKDQESVSSSVLEFEHLEAIATDSDMSSQPSPYHTLPTDAPKAVSTSSLSEFETLEVDVESEEVRKEADKVVQHLEELRDSFTVSQPNADMSHGNCATVPNTTLTDLPENDSEVFQNFSSNEFDSLVQSSLSDHLAMSTTISSTAEEQEVSASVPKFEDEDIVNDDAQEPFADSNQQSMELETSGHTAEDIQRIIDEASERFEEMRTDMSDSVLFSNLDSESGVEDSIRPERFCTVMSEGPNSLPEVSAGSQDVPGMMETSVDSLGSRDGASSKMSASIDSLKEPAQSPSVMATSSDSLQALTTSAEMVKSVDSIVGDAPLMEKSLDSLSSEVIHEPYLQESPVNTLSSSNYQDMVGSSASAVSDALMTQSTDSLGDGNQQDSSTMQASHDSLEDGFVKEGRDIGSTDRGDQTAVVRSLSEDSLGDDDKMTLSFHQSYPTELDPFSFHKENSESDVESRSTTSSRSAHTCDYMESDYRYEPRQKVFTMADVEAEREAKRIQKDSRGQSPTISAGSTCSEGTAIFIVDGCLALVASYKFN